MRSALLLLLGAALYADTDREPPGLDPKRLKLVKRSTFTGSVNGVSQAVMGEDGRTAALFENGHSAVVFYDTVKGEKLHEWNCGGGIHDGAFSGDGRYYATTHSDGTVKIYDIQNKKECGQFQGTGLA